MLALTLQLAYLNVVNSAVLSWLAISLRSILPRVCISLKRTLTHASSLIIAGAVNIHIDVATDPVTSKFTYILFLMAGTTFFTSVTHRSGHCLDSRITRQKLNMRSVIVDPPAVSVSDLSTIIAHKIYRFPKITPS